MPLIFLHYPEGALSRAALGAFAEEITTIALECEKLPNTPFVRSTVWIYASEYKADEVFVGGRPEVMESGTKVLSIEIHVFKGGLDDGAKQALIQQITVAARGYANIEPGKATPCIS